MTTNDGRFSKKPVVYLNNPHLWVKNDPKMKFPFESQYIYEFSDEEIFSEICSRLKKLRVSSCMSQEEFAKHCGVSRETIKRIESGNIKTTSS